MGEKKTSRAGATLWVSGSTRDAWFEGTTSF